MNNGWNIENRYESHALIFFIKEETVLNNPFLEFNFRNRQLMFCDILVDAFSFW